MSNYLGSPEAVSLDDREWAKRKSLSIKAARLVHLATDLVSSPDPELAREGRALLRSAAFLYTKAGEETKARQVTEAVEKLSRIAKRYKIRHRTGVGK